MAKRFLAGAIVDQKIKIAQKISDDHPNLPFDNIKKLVIQEFSNVDDNERSLEFSVNDNDDEKIRLKGLASETAGML